MNVATRSKNGSSIGGRAAARSRRPRPDANQSARRCCGRRRATCNAARPAELLRKAGRTEAAVRPGRRRAAAWRARGPRGGSPSQHGGRSRSTWATSVCSRGRASAARSRRARAGISHSVSSAVGFGGSGRRAARTRAPPPPAHRRRAARRRCPTGCRRWRRARRRRACRTAATRSASSAQPPAARDDDAVAARQVEGLVLRARPDEEHRGRDQQHRGLDEAEHLESPTASPPPAAAR